MTRPDTSPVRLRTPRLPAWALLCCVALLVASIPCMGQEMPIPADVQSALIAKILAFDKSLNGVGRHEVVVGILFQGGFRVSRTTKDELMATMERPAATNPNGLSVRFVPIELENGISVVERLEALGVDALYVTPLRAVDIRTIVSMSRSRKIITLTGVPDYAEEGIAVSIGVRDERPLIIVNLPAAKAEGADLSSQLLKVSKVIP